MTIRRALGAIVGEAGLRSDDAIVKQAMAEIEATFGSLRARVAAAKQGALAKRSTIVDACRVLGVKLPPLGKPVNLKLAYRQRGRKLRDHHPDIAVGDADLHKQMFQQITDAYDILCGYNERFNSTSEAQHG